MANQVRWARLSLMETNNRDERLDTHTLLPLTLKNFLGIFLSINKHRLLTFIITLPVNKPQVVVVLMEICCHLLEIHRENRWLKINDTLTDISRFNYFWSCFSPTCCCFAPTPSGYRCQWECKYPPAMRRFFIVMVEPCARSASEEGEHITFHHKTQETMTSNGSCLVKHYLKWPNYNVKKKQKAPSLNPAVSLLMTIRLSSTQTRCLHFAAAASCGFSHMYLGLTLWHGCVVQVVPD